ncbi:MAG: hypothetical protein HY290_04300 [Planctomycetia bacterium]|nr:hypothetical protein [Planctomycetia bacterium]
MVLEHVHRYRLTLPKILAGTEIVPKAGDVAARLTLDRLSGDGWLCTADLYPGHGGEQYYHLSEKGAQALGQDGDIAQPLKSEMRIESFAIATFCCCGDQFRELLTKEEFKRQFANLWFAGQPVRYYLDKGADGIVRLAYIKVDKVGPGDWDRLIESCSRFLRQRVDAARVAPEQRPRVEAFARLAKRGEFQFTVLTAVPEKKRAIELELQRRKLNHDFAPPITVHVVPGLFEVLFPGP